MSTVNKISKKANYYTERYRPQFHYSPQKNWMNDPNGMVFYRDEYHLFYQYHPEGSEWGPMHWGHAISKNMVDWEHYPIALEPDALGMIFSGSAVVDWNDTTGFFGGKEGLVAVFTHHSKEEVQSQSIAYSNDKGRTWIKYNGNPVIPNEGIKDFRDPKVFWHNETNEWKMVIAAGQKVMLYSSPNLKEWTYLSDFGANEGAHGGVWECPDLFRLPVDGNIHQQKWVLQVDLGDGAIAGGSGSQYFIGDFDGTTFVNENKPSETLWVDYGRDFYAAQSFSDVLKEDGRRICMAWMSNWRYANKVPTTPWRSAMSIPREMELRQNDNGNIKLFQKPITELQTLRQSKVNISNEFVNGDKNVLANQEEDVFEIVAEIENLSAVEFGFKVRKSSLNKEETIVGYNFNKEELFINRENSGENSFSEEFSGRHAVKLTSSKESIRLHLFIDKSSVELFFNDGEVVMTDLIFPKEDSKELELYVIDGEVKVISLEVYSLRSIWNEQR
ncbi:glycoside hydrolase family 32 protein [Bacillus solitudinis]|uniref:glycoside hydrolase family 32 protein n=1 Tax=Bacillus solitudinis TaxID=2014074 RepID=UPI000C24D9DF|nr:glycoside hydrolase family 32 protein [Bacillus solitudinis]